MTLSTQDHEVFRQIIRQEVLMGLPDPSARPPPADTEAEQILLAAILNCEHKPEDFPALKPEHFYEPLKRAVWQMASVLAGAGYQPKLPPILKALCEQGFSGPVAEDLVRIRDQSPSISLWQLREHASRIIELWRCRRLLEVMGQVRVELQCGAITHSEACARLQRYIEEHGE